VADEPTGNLDSRNSRAILELLCELQAQRELAIVMVTHDAQVARWAARTVHFEDGRTDAAAADGA
jgi:putative ABC transport system ATP-binding protein